MKIKQNTNITTGYTDYNILIPYTDNLNAEEIGLCFTSQYPKSLCVISFTKIFAFWTKMDVFYRIKYLGEQKKIKDWFRKDENNEGGKKDGDKIQRKGKGL